MPITRREKTGPTLLLPFKWRRILLLCCLPVLFLFLRRALLVVFLALKILGHTAGLDAWKGAVRHQTIDHAGIPIDVYTGDHVYSPLLIVHGVNPTGKNSLDLMRISGALAQAGYEVFVPDFPEMRKQHLEP